MHDPSFQGERPLRLKKEVDTASVLWGDDWRMPTFEEITMLADMSKFTWTVSSAGKDFYYEVTSKQTGNSIYLPYIRRHRRKWDRRCRLVERHLGILANVEFG